MKLIENRLGVVQVQLYFEVTTPGLGLSGNPTSLKATTPVEFFSTVILKTCSKAIPLHPQRFAY